jgi:hypothetical protein
MNLIIKYYIHLIITFLQINDTMVDFKANIPSHISNVFLKMMIQITSYIIFLYKMEGLTPK